MVVDLTFTVIPESIHMFHSLTALKVKKYIYSLMKFNSIYYLYSAY